MSVSLILLVSLLLQCLLVLLLLLVGAINESVRTADEDASVVVLVLLGPRCFEDADQEEAEVVRLLLALIVLMYAGRGYDPSPSFGIIIGAVATGGVVAVGPWTGVLVLEKDVPKLVLLLSAVTSTAFSCFDSCSSPLDLNRFLPNGSSCLCS
jgi:hypothetical protein